MTAGRRPHLYGAGKGIEPAHIPTLEVREIDLVVSRDRQPARPCSYWQFVLRDSHRRGIDLAHFVRAEFAKKRHSLAVDLDSVWQRAFGLHLLQSDLPCVRIEPAHCVPALRREPQDSPGIEDSRVRIIHAFIGHLVFRHLPCARIELSNVTAEIRRVPDVSVFVRHQAVRT